MRERHDAPGNETGPVDVDMPDGPLPQAPEEGFRFGESRLQNKIDAIFAQVGSSSIGQARVAPSAALPTDVFCSASERRGIVPSSAALGGGAPSGSSAFAGSSMFAQHQSGQEHLVAMSSTNDGSDNGIPLTRMTNHGNVQHQNTSSRRPTVPESYITSELEERASSELDQGNLMRDLQMDWQLEGCNTSRPVRGGGSSSRFGGANCSTGANTFLSRNATMAQQGMMNFHPSAGLGGAQSGGNNFSGASRNAGTTPSMLFQSMNTTNGASNGAGPQAAATMRFREPSNSSDEEVKADGEDGVSSSDSDSAFDEDVREALEYHENRGNEAGTGAGRVPNGTTRTRPRPARLNTQLSSGRQPQPVPVPIAGGNVSNGQSHGASTTSDPLLQGQQRMDGTDSQQLICSEMERAMGTGENGIEQIATLTLEPAEARNPRLENFQDALLNEVAQDIQVETGLRAPGTTTRKRTTSDIQSTETQLLATNSGSSGATASASAATQEARMRVTRAMNSSAASVSVPSSANKPCANYERYGHCVFDDNCKFSHAHITADEAARLRQKWRSDTLEGTRLSTSAENAAAAHALLSSLNKIKASACSSSSSTTVSGAGRIGAGAGRGVPSSDITFTTHSEGSASAGATYVYTGTSSSTNVVPQHGAFAAQESDSMMCDGGQKINVDVPIGDVAQPTHVVMAGKKPVFHLSGARDDPMKGDLANALPSVPLKPNAAARLMAQKNRTGGGTASATSNQGSSLFGGISTNRGPAATGSSRPATMSCGDDEDDEDAGVGAGSSGTTTAGVAPQPNTKTSSTSSSTNMFRKSRRGNQNARKKAVEREEDGAGPAPMDEDSDGL
ncbi:unnamed protein product [Amoebophrya sp. A25]|nr:unnamed protein product [Amoebophrya sp. A25]|eukprot:GSA25T00020136001.1